MHFIVESTPYVCTLEHDPLQRPIRIRSQALGSGSHETPNGNLIMDDAYQYDSAGNITERETEENAFQYGCDAIDRLTASRPAGLSEVLQSPSTTRLTRAMNWRRVAVSSSELASGQAAICAMTSFRAGSM